MRASYDGLLARLALVKTEIAGRHFEKDMQAVAFGGRVRQLVVDCFDALCDWSCRVQQTHAWKMSYPCSEERLAALGLGDSPENAATRAKPGFNYERCVRYNYDHAERSMLVDTVTMVKSLTSLLREAEGQLAPL